MERLTFKSKAGAEIALRLRGFTFCFAPHDRASAFYGSEIWAIGRGRNTAALWYPAITGGAWRVDIHPV
jgi:hypothetical protein